MEIFLVIFILIYHHFIENKYNNDLYFLNGERHFDFGAHSINLITSFTRYDFNFKTTYDYSPVVIVSLCNFNTSSVAYSLITVTKTGFAI